MSETTETTAETVNMNTPGADVALSRRSLQMRQFKSKATVTKCVKEQVIVPVGQIVGLVYEVQTRMGALPDGTQKESPFCVGDFEATVYETGEVMQAHGAYLPKYYCDALQAMLTNPDGTARKGMQSGCGFAVEVVLEPLGLDSNGLPKTIAFAYGVKNLVRRKANDPIEMMKRELQAANRLRLPPPSNEPPPPAVIDYEALSGAGEVGALEGPTEGQGPAPIGAAAGDKQPARAGGRGRAKAA